MVNRELVDQSHEGRTKLARFLGHTLWRLRRWVLTQEWSAWGHVNRGDSGRQR